MSNEEKSVQLPFGMDCRAKNNRVAPWDRDSLLEKQKAANAIFASGTAQANVGQFGMSMMSHPSYVQAQYDYSAWMRQLADRSRGS